MCSKFTILVNWGGGLLWIKICECGQASNIRLILKRFPACNWEITPASHTTLPTCTLRHHAPPPAPTLHDPLRHIHLQPNSRQLRRRPPQPTSTRSVPIIIQVPSVNIPPACHRSHPQNIGGSDCDGSTPDCPGPEKVPIGYSMLKTKNWIGEGIPNRRNLSRHVHTLYTNSFDFGLTCSRNDIFTKWGKDMYTTTVIRFQNPRWDSRWDVKKGCVLKNRLNSIRSNNFNCEKVYIIYELQER